MTEQKSVRLPEHIRPTRYVITLEPDLKKFVFKGRQTVDLTIAKPTRTIVVNADELKIQPAVLSTGSGKVFKSAAPTLDEQAETATFEFADAIPAGKATLDLEYTGILNDRLRGFYRSRYMDADGKERFMASTQFEPTDARRAIPCWDEPTFKAVFEVTLIVPEDLEAVSNMPIARRVKGAGGRKAIQFMPTPLMSTYLLAFVVGDLASISKRGENNTLVRIFATRGREKQGEFALDTAVRLLAYFNDYFGIPYPLAKLDHFAIPDFAAGAMENWGAITYRETTLLVDPANSSAGTRQLVAAIIAHEMAHMWFGDLVTMAWWDDLWLNESFASWMGDKATDALFPEWNVWNQFLVNDTARALALDGLKSSHPIEQEVRNPAEIGQLFDAISYSKGASVIRMLERFLGEDAFRKGMRLYMSRHKYGNASTEDLWKALAEASKQPVAEMMDTWTKQTGFPLVDVETHRDGASVEVTASQRRFLYEHLLEPDAADSTHWHVPLAVTASGMKSPKTHLMKGAQVTVRLPNVSRNPGWVKVNPEHTAFHRTRYTASDMAALLPAIRSLELPAADRLGIQNDAFALCRAGYITVTEYLNAVEAYVKETDESVWAELSMSMAALENLLGGTPALARLEEVGRRLYRPIVAKMGWDKKPGEGNREALLRSIVLNQLGSFGDEAVLKEAARRFRAYVKDPTSVHPDIRRVVFGLAAKRGGPAMYDRLWRLHKESPLQEEKVRLLSALTQFERAELLDRTLERSLSKRVRAHETISVVVGVAGNPQGRDKAWEFIKGNWREFDRRYGEGGFGLMQLVSVAGGFTTKEKLRDVESFFAETPVPTADRTIRQSLERIRLNVAWLERNRKDLAAWGKG
ncbi:MAG: M1 family metallopeptidase [SAR202 cluster bacterium]|nr:M1 family metallopeptidase [SAR202 cluster bacterium]